jgi:hypothetical protein
MAAQPNDARDDRVASRWGDIIGEDRAMNNQCPQPSDVHPGDRIRSEQRGGPSRSRSRRPTKVQAVPLIVALILMFALVGNWQKAVRTHNTGQPPTRAVTGPRWVPGVVSPWQWLLSHPLDVANPTDMGTGVVGASGQPAADPVVYDIDGFSNPDTTVTALHAAGKRAICYIETGAWESYRPDAAMFPAAVLGKTMEGYPDERYLDIRASVVVEIIEARIKMCADKGFDAVEPDIDDSYTADTGFPLTMADNVAFNTTIANYAHGLGLAIGLKNGDSPEFAAAMAPRVDFALTEQCFEFDTCASYTPFTQAGKAVFAAEYDLDTTQFCPAAAAREFNATRFDVALAGHRQPCS